MILLEALALKVVMAQRKEEFRTYHPSNENGEELRSTGKMLWNLAMEIIPKAEKCGAGAIRLIGILVTFDTPILPQLRMFSERLKVLSDYHFLEPTSGPATNSMSFIEGRSDELNLDNQLMMEVIREKMKENETEWLRDCLKILKHNIFAVPIFTTYKGNTPSGNCWRNIWSKALKYPQLVREFKYDGFNFCSESYLSQNDDLSTSIQLMRKTTLNVFIELFGENDVGTIQLRNLEFRYQQQNMN